MAGLNETHAFARARISTDYDITLPRENCTTLTFRWDTNGLAKGNYAIGAYATPVPAEASLADNNFTDGWVIIAMPGDITGPEGFPDGKCDIRDIAHIAKRFGRRPWEPMWDANCDVTGSIIGVPDGKIDIKDLATVARAKSSTPSSASIIPLDFKYSKTRRIRAVPIPLLGTVSRLPLGL